MTDIVEQLRELAAVDNCQASIEAADEIERLQKLWTVCEKFIKEQRISCPETIGQCDWVIENAYGFIEDICDVVGYDKSEDV